MKYVSGIVGCILGMIVGFYLIIYTSSQISSTYEAPDGLKVLIMVSILGALVGAQMILNSEGQSYAFLRCIKSGSLIMFAHVGSIITIFFVIDLVMNYGESDPKWIVLFGTCLLSALLGALCGVGFHLGFRAFNYEKKGELP